MWTGFFEEDSIAINDGNLVTNVVKLIIHHGIIAYPNFVGFFLPKSTPFMHEDGNNKIDIVSTRPGVACYIYGSQDGSGKI